MRQTKAQKIEATKRKQARQEEYAEYRQILKSIACDPYEVSANRINAIKELFDYDDRRRELAGYDY